MRNKIIAVLAILTMIATMGFASTVGASGYSLPAVIAVSNIDFLNTVGADDPVCVSPVQDGTYELRECRYNEVVLDGPWLVDRDRTTIVQAIYAPIPPAPTATATPVPTATAQPCDNGITDRDGTCFTLYSADPLCYVGLRDGEVAQTWFCSGVECDGFLPHDGCFGRRVLPVVQPDRVIVRFTG